MKRVTKVLFFICFSTFCSCDDEELTGNARLVFSGNNLENMEIDVYPEGVFILRDIAATKPILEDLPSSSNGEVFVSGLNSGNYTWYDGLDNIGFFQISAGQTKTYEISIVR